VCDLENLVNEEALTHWGAVVPREKKTEIIFIISIFYVSDSVNIVYFVRFQNWPRAGKCVWCINYVYFTYFVPV